MAALVLTLFCPGLPLRVSGRYSACTAVTSPSTSFSTIVHAIT